MNNILLSITMFFFLAVAPSYSQNRYEYKNVKNTPRFVKKYKRSLETNRLKRTEDFVNALEYMPKDYVTDGTEDYTLFIQQALDENKNVLLPNFDILINDSGLEVQSNQTILFDVHTTIKLKASSKTNYEILRIHNKQNVKLYSPTIVGDRYDHLGTKGEWGMGISIRSSNNIEIINPNIRDCWGDGIYIGQLGGKPSSNVSVAYGHIDNNRRNGVSVISADVLNISNIIVSNTNGTNPQAGIDFEPNNAYEVLKNINLSNIYTFNNFHQGVFYCLNKINSEATKIDIRLTNHIDNYSPVAIGIMNLTGKNNNTAKLVKGKIVLKNIDGDGQNVNLRVFNNSKLDNLSIYLSKRNNRSKFNSKGSLNRIHRVK